MGIQDLDQCPLHDLVFHGRDAQWPVRAGGGRSVVIPSVGTVVLVRFPFSDLSRSKLRPAVVLADTGRNDWVLCQITSQPYADPLAVEITNSDLVSGSFRKNSYARAGKLFTANAAIMTKEIGELKSEKLEEIIRTVISLLEKSIV